MANCSSLTTTLLSRGEVSKAACPVDFRCHYSSGGIQGMEEWGQAMDLLLSRAV